MDGENREQPKHESGASSSLERRLRMANAAIAIAMLSQTILQSLESKNMRGYPNDGDQQTEMR